MNDNKVNGESLLCLIGEFINLVSACEYKHVKFEPVDGFTLQDCRDTINTCLEGLGFSEDDIEDIWTGETQLTSLRLPDGGCGCGSG